MLSKALNYLEEKYSDPATQELLDISSFMDPRFRTSYISAENVPQIKARVKREMEEVQVALKEKRAAITPDAAAVPQSAAQEGAGPSAAKKAKRRSLGSYFKSCGDAGPPASSAVFFQEAIEAELNSYLLSSSIDSEDDPLAWWKLHSVSFPILSKLARKYLCIPATSAPSERVFSAGGNVVTCQRSCLKPKVDMLVFLTKNV